MTDDFDVVFDVNGATNRGAKNSTVTDVTWGVDTLRLPDVSLTREADAGSYAFEGW